MVSCSNCGQQWPFDPIFEVECPQCRAAIRKKCKRPSGHSVWGGFHSSRDVLAMQKIPDYGKCPASLKEDGNAR